MFNFMLHCILGSIYIAAVEEVRHTLSIDKYFTTSDTDSLDLTRECKLTCIMADMPNVSAVSLTPNMVGMFASV
ncbi:MAG TPA: hypothetical protein PLF24_01965 [Ruminococcus sp.]|nr:hypothetical protein [Ruminococcus sp.]